MKAPIEYLLHFLLVKGDFLQISLVVMIEIGQGFLTGVKVNTKEGLEVLVGYLPHSEGLLGGVGQEAQEDADGVLGWDGKEVDVAGSQGELNVSEQGEGAGATEYEWLHSHSFNGGVLLLY